MSATGKLINYHHSEEDMMKWKIIQVTGSIEHESTVVLHTVFVSFLAMSIDFRDKKTHKCRLVLDIHRCTQ